MSDDPIADGLQKAVESGHVVVDYVVIAYYERMDGEGQHRGWYEIYTPRNQPEHVTDGLIDRAEHMRAMLVDDEDDD